MIERCKSQSGFSLVEVLASMTVFAIVVSGLAGTTMATIKSTTTSRATSAASALIQDKVEEMRSLDPETDPADFAAGLHIDAENPMTATGESEGHYERSWEVVADTPSIGMSEVIITVTWTSATGPKSLAATTFICVTDKCA